MKKVRLDKCKERVFTTLTITSNDRNCECKANLETIRAIIDDSTIDAKVTPDDIATLLLLSQPFIVTFDSNNTIITVRRA